MTITDNIAGESYNKLIHYALKQSDAVMLVWQELSAADRIKTAADWQRETLEVFPNFLITPEIITQWEEMEHTEKEALEQAKRIRTPFIDSLSPFMVKLRHNPEWPSTKVVFCNCTYNIAVYRVCEELSSFLLKPGSYFSWRYPMFPEDLSFFKGNRCWLYASSHEGYLEFLPRSRDEYDFVCSLEVSLDVPYKPIDDAAYFQEDYIL